MHSKYIDTSNLLTNLINKKLIDSTLLINYKLDTLFTYENSLLPNNMPVEGIVTKGLGNLHSNHKGIDIASWAGAPIQVTADGLIEYAGWSRTFGYVVVVDHNYGYRTIYAHCSQILVNKREFVKKGQVIAQVGSTGLSTGPHLHYEFLVNGKHRNPRTVPLPKSNPINEHELKRFRTQMQPTLALLENRKSPNLLTAATD